jgi:methylthioribose-1-phosphate isomerase
MLKTVYREQDKVVILDQTRLPGEVVFLQLTTPLEVAAAIKKMNVRGAPLIGVVAALGFAQGVGSYQGETSGLSSYVEELYQLLQSTRPTAVNLFWALDKMRGVFVQNQHLPLTELKSRLWTQAEAMIDEDRCLNQKIGEQGSQLIKPGSRVLTVCNAGALATCGHGTALGIVRSAFAEGKIAMVYACETRPVLQGARLTVWELTADQIPVTLITDNMAAYLMQQGQVDLVVVGADRIAANGDTANKIGTYSVAVLAHAHGIPFYIAAPTSTIDLKVPSGQEIPIEERNPQELRELFGVQTAPAEVPVYNPAFDVTPAKYITGIITEKGIVSPPFSVNLLKIMVRS